MSQFCKYCHLRESKQHEPGLVCETCYDLVHLNCLRSQNTPGNFAGDVFFEFTCEDCSPDHIEILKRNKFQWVNVLILTMNHLQNEMQGISNRGFFHYKTHICSFIDRHWLVLFGPSFKRTKNWVGTIVGALSLYNSLFFRSGSTVLGELGWWKLMHSFSPAVAAHIVQELGKDKPKRIRNQIALDMKLFNRKVIEMGYGDYFDKEEYKPDDSSDPGLSDPSGSSDQVLCKGESPPQRDPPTKKQRLNSEDGWRTAHDLPDSDSRSDQLDSTYGGSFPKDMSEEHLFHGFDFTPSYDDSSAPPLSDRPPHHYDSEPLEPPSDDERSAHSHKPDKKKEERVEFKRESLFSTQLNSTDLPWEEKEPELEKDLVELTEYEEIHLLKSVEGLLGRVRDAERRAGLQRLRATLALRRRKRHKHLPLFDIDRAVKVLGGYVTDDPKVFTNADRILDRFQRSYLMDNLCGTVVGSVAGPLLLSRAGAAPLRSAYSGALLKPYIRRDCTSRPLWLRLREELLRKTNGWGPEVAVPRAPVDYSYVQPHHIAALNSLCAQFFWPGIDLTEALQYPEFSCVVSYGRLVVACAFLVPDVRPAEAYVSFVLTRPEWRNAGIASFMLYHLLQTCTGKDVTLHVSPTNPAIFLYQKFGFKVEELIQDFYEKYYDIDYTGCRHALFLRLTR